MNTNIEIQPQDLAMEKFRQTFPVLLARPMVSSCGLRMSYDLTFSHRKDEYLAMAETIIIIGGLPLKPYLQPFGKGIYLVIAFDQTELVPENY
jgi:hypothetical protein